jgi:GYF domain 2/Domain of unknown function (DUF4190)
MSENAPTWYIRNRGKVLGPFAWNQLESMRDRGQLARFHEVSQDRKTWMSAASLADLFPGVEGRPAIPYANTYEVGAQQPTILDTQEQPVKGWSGQVEPPAWFFSRAGTQEGPVTYPDLQRMASQGEVTPETLVWREGMADWLPCRQFPDLFSPGQRPPLNPPVSPLGQPVQAAAPPAYSYGPPRTSGLAIASLVLGILGLPTLLLVIGSLLATIFGAVALGLISRSNGTLTGRGMAIAGLVLGIIGLALFALVLFTGILRDPAANLDRRRF